MRTAILSVLAGAVLSACGGAPPATEGPVYPEALQRGTVLDVQVMKRPTELTLTNTSARAFGPSMMWLNGRYGRAIDGFAVGQTLTLKLSEFRDEYNEGFRPGGFFATRTPQKLVLAELQTAGAGGTSEIVGFIVVRGPEEE